LEELLSKALNAVGFHLSDWETSNHGKQLRIFIEKNAHLNDPSGGVTLSDCELVSRHLQRVFEVEGIDYDRLEVSSPGLDRKLKVKADFERFIGLECDVQLRILVSGRRHICGFIKGVAEDCVMLETESGPFAFDMVNLKRARLVPKL